MSQLTFVAFSFPLFRITALTPIPPVITSICKSTDSIDPIFARCVKFLPVVIKVHCCIKIKIHKIPIIFFIQNNTSLFNCL